MKSRILSPARLSFPLAAAITALLAAQSASAAPSYWDGTSASWNTVANWSTASGATTPDPLALPGAADDAIFNITSVNGAETITLDADQAIQSMTFNNTDTTTLTGGGTARTLTLGTGGITMAATAGAVTLGDGTAGNNVLLSLATGAQTWTNNSAAAFTINNTAATFTRATGATLTFNQASTGTFAIDTTELPLTNSIVGPWAFFGTGSNQRYANITSGNITGLTGTTAALVNNMTSATTNYEYTAATSSTAGSNSLTANTLRTSLANTISLSNSSGNIYNLYLNGILATGSSGTFTISRTAGTSIRGLQIGSTGELVIAGQQAVTISSPIFEAGGAGRRVVYSGSNILTLSGASAYTGGTYLNSGKLVLSSNSAAGTGSIAVSGATAILEISEGKTLANATNHIILSDAGAKVNRVVAASAAYTTGTAGNLKSLFTAGQADTNAKILAGTNSNVAATTLDMQFSSSLVSTPSNDSARSSDIFTISGVSLNTATVDLSDTDTYVLQLTTDAAGGLAAGSMLAWLSGGSWVNAGDTFYNAAFAGLGTHGLGSFGYDSSNQSVWAVVDHTGSFAAIPEPTTSALAGLVLTAGLLRRRRA